MTVLRAPAPIHELCSADYSATQLRVPDGPRQVYVVAQGVHPTSGYQVNFTATPLDVFPPELALWHIKPSGIVSQIVTPFSKFWGFDAEDTIASIVVHDVRGPHKIKVEQIGEQLLGKESFLSKVMVLLKDGPFPM